MIFFRSITTFVIALWVITASAGIYVDKVDHPKKVVVLKIEGRIKQRSTSIGGAGGLLDMLANASKNRTAEMVAEKRQQLETEKVEAPAEV